MIKRTSLFIAISAAASGVSAATFEFHGDFNNRFQVYQDQAKFQTSDSSSKVATLGSSKGDASVADSYGELKYRMWTTATTDDGNAKAVYAVEIGGVKFGSSGGSGKGKGGGFSGDGANVETRWAYTEFKLPSHKDHTARVGLFPYKLNGFVWQETVTGISLAGPLNNDTSYMAAAVRGHRNAISSAADDFKDAAGYSFSLTNKSIKGSTLGAFLLYQIQDPGAANASSITDAGYEIKSLGGTQYEIATLGLTGKHSLNLGSNKAFFNWDVIYQNGYTGNSTFKEVASTSTHGSSTSTASTFDLSAYFINLQAGVHQGDAKFSYTLWYASGDDNSSDNNLDGFIATDVDRDESIIFFEGGYSDDDYYSERSYFLDKGVLMNRLGVDFKSSNKLTVGGALISMQTAEDIKYTDDNGVARSESDLGIEVDAYAKYKLYPTMELALNVGYLSSGDAMDYFDLNRDGSADSDILKTTARLRYKF